MRTLTLRNDRSQCGVWLGTFAVFAVAAAGALVGLVAANVRDPKALWMGPQVKAPQAIYLFLEGLALVVALLMAAGAAFKARKFRDRSPQVVLDEAGIQDLRGNGRRVPWSQVANVTGKVLYSGGIATVAQLLVEAKDGDAVAVDILHLDRDPKDIVKAAKRMLAEADGG